jgi:hypothetical protein
MLVTSKAHIVRESLFQILNHSTEATDVPSIGNVVLQIAGTEEMLRIVAIHSS